LTLAKSYRSNTTRMLRWEAFSTMDPSAPMLDDVDVDGSVEDGSDEDGSDEDGSYSSRGRRSDKSEYSSSINSQSSSFFILLFLFGIVVAVVVVIMMR